MIINNAVLTGSFIVNGVNYITNTPTTGSNTFVGTQTTSGSVIITGSLQVTGSIATTGTITAQTLVVQTVTSSIVYSSGSNIFGNSQSNVQQMTGSLFISGSNVLIGTTTSNGFKFKVSNNGAEEIAINPGDSANLNNYVNYNRSTSTYIAANYLAATHSFLNGNVGIGTASPSRLLEVNGDATLQGNNYINSAKMIQWEGGGYWSFRTVSSAATFQLYQGSTGNTPIAVTTNGQTNFKHSTTNLDVVTLENGSASPYGMNITYTAVSPNNGSNNYLYFADSTTLRFAARSNGGLSNYSGNNVNLASDRRLKKDISPLSTEWDKLKQIEVVNFKYKDSTDETALYGAIAQQVQEVYPNLVIVTREATETEPEYYGLREQPFQWLTTKVLQEAMAKIEEQQIQIESQNTLIQELTTRLTALENK